MTIPCRFFIYLMIPAIFCTVFQHVLKKIIAQCGRLHDFCYHCLLSVTL